MGVVACLGFYREGDVELSERCIAEASFILGLSDCLRRLWGLDGRLRFGRMALGRSNVVGRRWRLPSWAWGKSLTAEQIKQEEKETRQGTCPRFERGKMESLTRNLASSAWAAELPLPGVAGFAEGGPFIFGFSPERNREAKRRACQKPRALSGSGRQGQVTAQHLDQVVQLRVVVLAGDDKTKAAAGRASRVLEERREDGGGKKAAAQAGGFVRVPGEQGDNGARGIGQRQAGLAQCRFYPRRVPQQPWPQSSGGLQDAQAG